MDVGSADAQVAEEHLREHRVVVLARVHDGVADSGLPEGGVDGGQFDELRAGADHGENVHDRTLLGSCAAIVPQ